MPKQLAFSDEARRELKEGIDELARAVTTTLGPKGRNVALGKKWGAPTITHDGVTVARDVELAQPYHDMGVRLLKQAASKTNDIAGDGTTTATLLAHAMVTEGLKNVAAGANAMQMKRGIQKATDVLVEVLKELAIPINTREDMANVATISAQDREIGDVIADAMEKVGKDGVITVEDGRGLGLETKFVEGMEFNRGYISPYFITDFQTREAVLENPLVLIHEKRISTIQELVPLMEKLVEADRRDLLIIAEDVEREALSLLVLNKVRGKMNVAAVKAPDMGNRRLAILQDMAVLTGALIVQEATGRTLETTQLKDLGRCEKVVITKDNTTIIGGQGSDEEIDKRIAQIRAEIEHAVSEYDRSKIEERLARMVGGVAVIGVGAATETELKEKKHRVEDALSATRAAVEEGIVPGGGVALVNIRSVLDEVTGATPDEQTGINIVRQALTEPMQGIVRNAGLEGAVIVDEVRRRQQAQKNNKIGFDVMTGKYTDMVAAGIVDPAKVTRGALTNAASVAAMILTTEALVTLIPELEPPTPKPRSPITYS